MQAQQEQTINARSRQICYSSTSGVWGHESRGGVISRVLRSIFAATKILDILNVCYLTLMSSPGSIDDGRMGDAHPRFGRGLGRSRDQGPFRRTQGRQGTRHGTKHYIVTVLHVTHHVFACTVENVDCWSSQAHSSELPLWFQTRKMGLMT